MTKIDIRLRASHPRPSLRPLTSADRRVLAVDRAVRRGDPLALPLWEFGQLGACYRVQRQFGKSRRRSFFATASIYGTLLKFHARAALASFRRRCGHAQ